MSEQPGGTCAVYDAAINDGLSPEQAQRRVDDHVFGPGNNREVGIGAKGNETRGHFNALKQAERMGLEPVGAFDAAVAEIWRRDAKRATALGLPKLKAV
jgi:hypothetical protein